MRMRGSQFQSKPSSKSKQVQSCMVGDTLTDERQTNTLLACLQKLPDSPQPPHCLLLQARMLQLCSDSGQLGVTSPAQEGQFSPTQDRANTASQAADKAVGSRCLRRIESGILHIDAHTNKVCASSNLQIYPSGCQVPNKASLQACM